MTSDPSLPEREAMDFDVVIVGAGPAGLAAAIRLKQLNAELSVIVLEKGAEVGAHILSGAVIDPQGLDELLPNWRAEPNQPLTTQVTDDRFWLLGHKSRVALPNFLLPPMMNNHGNYIGSLGALCKWLAGKAEELGVEIYPGFAATELLFNEQGSLRGVATGDTGVEKDGTAGPRFARGMEILGKYTLFAEGARGSLSKQLIADFGLGRDRQPQKFGIGIKEIWEVPAEDHQPGLVQHTMGWPLDNRTGGGSFLYHYGDNLVAVGLVVHLDYRNPFLSPFDEFQRLKTHPAIRPMLKAGKRISYGARAISEGGYQSVPKLAFPGGALLGCSAGFVNVPRIKGSHNAILSGVEAARATVEAIAVGRSHDTLEAYEDGWRSGPIGRDLRPVRNVKPLWSRLGLWAGMGAAGFDMWCNTILSNFSFFGTLGHKKSDSASLEPAALHKPIAYPAPDGQVSFDRLSSVFLSNTNHDHGQPSHLKVGDLDIHTNSELKDFEGPSTRYCPAGVYEWQTSDDGSPRYVINAQNCVHCKTCDIKDPNQNITWVPPNGGEGPIYTSM